VLGEGLEYPRFDSRMSGKAARHLYKLSRMNRISPCRALVRHNFAAAKTHRVDAGQAPNMSASFTFSTILEPSATKQNLNAAWRMRRAYR
jgi:hypothetical protein